MSAYENVVGGKLKLKGKALDVKAGGIKKKKKKQKDHVDEVKQQKQHFDEVSETKDDELVAGGSTDLILSGNKEEIDDGSRSLEGSVPHSDDHLTPAERRYMEQRDQIDKHKMAKTSNKSHRDRIEDFNQYLANMSEHYDIPKVGPG